MLEILQLILWTMNSCERHQDAAHLNCSPMNNGQHDYQQPPLSNPCKKKSIEEGHFLAPQIPENHRKLNPQCLRSSGPPPRPFKKARYAWEIKNYDYTLKKMTQNLTQPENQSQNTEARVEVSQVQDEASNYNVNPGQVAVPNPVQEERMPDAQMLGQLHHQGYNMGLLSTSYQAHYGAVMEANLNHQNALSHEERLNTFHNQIPEDPDARLIRWHTRQLCRSIFDNTVNRMLENMGFSPVTERSQALHPLLVLSLSDDEERETEEAHQRSLESQALSVALHQKGFLPPTYHYDTLESATTSDYDSSEEESELGEVVPDELAEQPNIDPSIQSNPEEDPYIQVSSPPSHHSPPSPAHLDNNSSPQDPVPTINQLPSETQNNISPAQNLSNLQFACDDSESHPLSNHFLDEQESRDTSPNLGNKEIAAPHQHHTNRECIPRCKSLECSNEQLNTEYSYEKKLKLDDNENCISSPKQETIIEGKVERVLDNCHTPALTLDANDKNVNNNNSSSNNKNNNGDSSYFIRNAIHLAIKQQGLGFQKA